MFTWSLVHYTDTIALGLHRNLPNIPLSAASADALLDQGQTSSTFDGDRSADGVLPEVSAAMLDLHYICLRQARLKQLINPKGGAILSSMGGRVVIQSMLDMASTAGYTARVVSLSWKVQSEPETVICEYAESQRTGRGMVSLLLDAGPQAHKWRHNSL